MQAVDLSPPAPETAPPKREAPDSGHRPKSGNELFDAIMGRALGRSSQDADDSRADTVSSDHDRPVQKKAEAEQPDGSACADHVASLNAQPPPPPAQSPATGGSQVTPIAGEDSSTAVAGASDGESTQSGSADANSAGSGSSDLVKEL